MATTDAWSTFDRLLGAQMFQQVVLEVEGPDGTRWIVGAVLTALEPVGRHKAADNARLLRAGDSIVSVKVVQ